MTEDERYFSLSVHDSVSTAKPKLELLKILEDCTSNTDTKEKIYRNPHIDYITNRFLFLFLFIVIIILSLLISISIIFVLFSILNIY